MEKLTLFGEPECTQRQNTTAVFPAAPTERRPHPPCTNGVVLSFSLASKRRKAWVRAIRRYEGPDFSVTSNTSAWYSAHFTASNFRPPSGGQCRGEERIVARLTGDAVPSIFAIAWTKKSKPRKSSVERVARKDASPCPQLVGPTTLSDTRTISTPNVYAADNQVDDVDPAKSDSSNGGEENRR